MGSCGQSQRTSTRIVVEVRGFARVSTTRQDLDRQLDALGKHGIPDERIYADKTIGARICRVPVSRRAGGPSARVDR